MIELKQGHRYLGEEEQGWGNDRLVEFLVLEIAKKAYKIKYFVDRTKTEWREKEFFSNRDLRHNIKVVEDLGEYKETELSKDSQLAASDKL